MIAKLFGLALVAGPFVLPSDIERPVLTSHPFIHQVVCPTSRGSAFQISDTIGISVHHVTKYAGCKINGIPIEVIESDEVGDFSIIRFPFRRKGGLRWSCEGFRPGGDYAAIGYARGLPFQRATSARFYYGLPLAKAEWVTLWTAVRYIPGMSGGPVFNARGHVVGTVNAYSLIWPMSFSRSLSETSLCRRAG